VEEANDSAAIVGEADVTDADLRHALSQMPGSRRLWVWLTLLAVFALLYIGLRPEGFDRDALLTMVLPMAFAAVGVAYFQVAGGRAWVKQALTNVGGPTTFRFDAYGFSSESKLRQHRLAWAGLNSARETPAAFLVYTTPRTILIVPKRAFSEAQVATLGRWLQERITAKPLQPTGGLGGRGVLLLWVVLIVTFLSIWHFLSDDGPPHRQRAKRQNTAASARSSSLGGEPSDVDSSP